MKVAKRPPQLWKGAVQVTKEHYQLWALLPHKLGDIFKQNNYWVTSDGMKFVNSKDAADYYLVKQNNIAVQIPYLKDMLTAESSSLPVLSDSSSIGNARARQERTIPERRVIKPEILKSSKQNEAVSLKSSGFLKLEQLIKQVDELKKELGYERN